MTMRVGKMSRTLISSNALWLAGWWRMSGGGGGGVGWVVRAMGDDAV